MDLDPTDKIVVATDCDHPIEIATVSTPVVTKCEANSKFSTLRFQVSPLANSKQFPFAPAKACFKHNKLWATLENLGALELHKGIHFDHDNEFMFAGESRELVVRGADGTLTLHTGSLDCSSPGTALQITAHKVTMVGHATAQFATVCASGKLSPEIVLTVFFLQPVSGVFAEYIYDNTQTIGTCHIHGIGSSDFFSCSRIAGTSTTPGDYYVRKILQKAKSSASSGKHSSHSIESVWDQKPVAMRLRDAAHEYLPWSVVSKPKTTYSIVSATGLKGWFLLKLDAAPTKSNFELWKTKHEPELKSALSFFFATLSPRGPKLDLALDVVAGNTASNATSSLVETAANMQNSMSLQITPVDDKQMRIAFTLDLGLQARSDIHHFLARWSPMPPAEPRKDLLRFIQAQLSAFSEGDCADVILSPHLSPSVGGLPAQGQIKPVYESPDAEPLSWSKLLTALLPTVHTSDPEATVSESTTRSSVLDKLRETILTSIELLCSDVPEGEPLHAMCAEARTVVAQWKPVLFLVQSRDKAPTKKAVSEYYLESIKLFVNEVAPKLDPLSFAPVVRKRPQLVMKATGNCYDQAKGCTLLVTAPDTTDDVKVTLHSLQACDALWKADPAPTTNTVALNKQSAALVFVKMCTVKATADGFRHAKLSFNPPPPPNALLALFSTAPAQTSKLAVTLAPGAVTVTTTGDVGEDKIAVLSLIPPAGARDSASCSMLSPEGHRVPALSVPFSKKQATFVSRLFPKSCFARITLVGIPFVHLSVQNEAHLTPSANVTTSRKIQIVREPAALSQPMTGMVLTLVSIDEKVLHGGPLFISADFTCGPTRDSYIQPAEITPQGTVQAKLAFASPVTGNCHDFSFAGLQQVGPDYTIQTSLGIASTPSLVPRVIDPHDDVTDFVVRVELRNSQVDPRSQFILFSPQCPNQKQITNKANQDGIAEFTIATLVPCYVKILTGGVDPIRVLVGKGLGVPVIAMDGDEESSVVSEDEGDTSEPTVVKETTNAPKLDLKRTGICNTVECVVRVTVKGGCELFDSVTAAVACADKVVKLVLPISEDHGDHIAEFDALKMIKELAVTENENQCKILVGLGDLRHLLPKDILGGMQAYHPVTALYGEI
eukprot:c11457_g1_i1.p1 GENE.c11457_g1_i1~~c11457_g1_i1.p1  ORF type:complete len:1118 (+),score=353.21 c11457_g1_i1:1-3354(+)